MVDIKDNQIGSIEEEFTSLISLLLSTALLNGRLSKHFETNTGYDLNICLYYCQFDYCFFSNALVSCCLQIAKFTPYVPSNSHKILPSRWQNSTCYLPISP